MSPPDQTENKGPPSPDNTTTTAPTAAVESTADIADIASTLAATMPEVQEHAVQQAAEQARAAESSPTDKAGARFDPAIHVSGADGKGVLTVRGTWAQKRGRKSNTAGATAAPRAASGNVAGSASQLGASASPAETQKAALTLQSRQAGIAAAEMMFMAGRVIGGEEWLPMKNEKLGLDERAMMHSAFGDYFVATNKVDIPPGAALAFAMCAYMGPRFTMPQTQARFKAIKQKIVQWWINRKLRKQGLTAEVKQKPTADAAK